MNFDVPKITRPLLLSNYAPEFPADALLQVWVNPPRRILEVINEIGSSEQPDAEKSVEVYAELWGISREELLKFVNTFAETDPGLAPWCMAQSIFMISQHRNQLKKNWMTPLFLLQNEEKQNSLN